MKDTLSYIFMVLGSGLILMGIMGDWILAIANGIFLTLWSFYIKLEVIQDNIREARE